MGPADSGLDCPGGSESGLVWQGRWRLECLQGKSLLFSAGVSSSTVWFAADWVNCRSVSESPVSVAAGSGELHVSLIEVMR